MNGPLGNAYFGTLGQRAETERVQVGEYLYSPHLHIARHWHARPYVSLVVHGDYRETVGSNETEVDGPTAIVHAPGEAHADHFGPAGAVILSLDMPDEWFDAGLGRSRSVHAGTQVEAAILALARELRRRDGGARWFVESAVLHLVGTLVASPRSHGRGRWMPAVVEFLRAHYAAPVRLGELAAIAKVHPVHLARRFREVQGCTVGEFVRRLRVERALAELQRSDRPLAEIAAAHGFSDQSHLTRLVRARTGRTPGAWRRGGVLHRGG